MTKNTSSGKTPEKITKLLKEAVEKKGQSAVARESGIALFSVQRYLKGIGEPSTRTFKKLADYFKVSIPWLRGDIAREDAKEDIELCIKIVKDLLAIYELVPDNFKETLAILIEGNRDELLECVAMHEQFANKKNIDEAIKINIEAYNLIQGLREQQN